MNVPPDVTRLLGEVRSFVFDGEVDPNVVRDADHPDWRYLVSETVTSNLVTNIGRQQMTKLIVGETTARAAYIALSTSVVTPALTDTVSTIPNRQATQALAVIESNATYYQRYTAYFATTSFGSTGINTEALLDASSTASTTNLWADAVVTISKSTTQSLVVEHRILAST